MKLVKPKLLVNAVTELYQSHEGIEGDKVDGHSRNPLKPRGPSRFHGILCTRYTASFDVVAKITDRLSEDPFYTPPSEINESDETRQKLLTDLGDSIKCDKVIIHTLAKGNRINCVAAASATHQAQFWDFNRHTHALIEVPHEQLVNAIEKSRQTLERTAARAEISESLDPKHKVP